MSKPPTITSILALPGPPTSSAQESGSEPARPPGPDTLMVGLVVDERHISWGECHPAGGSVLPQFPQGFRPQEGQRAIERIIAPALQGQALSGFRPLAAMLDELTETATIREPIAPADAAQPRETVTRRQLLTGIVPADAVAGAVRSPGRQVVVERPLHPALAYGVSQALLAAVARSRAMSMAEVLAGEYGLDVATAVAPLHVELGQARPGVANRLVALRPASVGYTAAAGQPAAEFGANAERLQAYVRQLKEWLAATVGAAYRPAISLDLQGGLTALYGDNLGRILGALSGLEGAAAPHQLRVANIISSHDQEQLLAALAQLKEYLRLRHMSLQLAASAAGVLGADALQISIERNAIAAVHLDMVRLGGLQHTVELAAAARKQKMLVLLSGVAGRLVAQVALATRPDLVAVNAGAAAVWRAGQLWAEMRRALAWREYQAG